MITSKRINAETAIKETARKKFVSVEKVMTEILAVNVEHLLQYVRSKYETPTDTFQKLVTQAALLRYVDIKKSAVKHGVNDDEGLKRLEEYETENSYTNSAEFILKPEISACLNLILKQKQGSKLKNVGSLLNSAKGFNGFDDAEPWLGEYSSTSSQQPTTAASVGNWANTAGSILDVFNKVVDGIDNVKNSTEQLGASVGSTVDKFGNKVSDVGSDSITKSLKENLPTILLIVGAVVVIIVIAIYANKRK